MRRIALILLMLAPLCYAQDWMTITATNIVDGRAYNPSSPSAPHRLPNGKFCATVTGDNGQFVNYRVGGGGQGTSTPYCGWVKDGAIQVQLQVPNAKRTFPPNIKYRIEISDGASVIRRDLGVLISDDAAWCGANAGLPDDVCNYDMYVPSTVVLQTGQSVDDLGVGVLRFPDGTTQTTSPDTALSAKVSTSRQVNGHALTADVTLTKSDVGMGSADNTSDADKPISTATQAALDAKANSNTLNAHASASQAHGANGAIVGATDLSAGLATKAPAVHGHAIADVTNLQSTLDGKADSATVASQLAAKADAASTSTALAAKANAGANTDITSLGALTTVNAPVNAIAALASAPTITQAGTSGATSYNYAVVARNAAGTVYTALGPVAYTATGAATLNGTNYNTITFPALPANGDCYDVYRITSGGTPSTVGQIASCQISSYTDKGAAASGYPPFSPSWAPHRVDLPIGCLQLPCRVAGLTLANQTAAVPAVELLAPATPGHYVARGVVWLVTQGSGGSLAATNLHCNNGLVTLYHNISGSISATASIGTDNPGTSNCYSVAGQKIGFGNTSTATGAFSYNLTVEVELVQ